MSYFDGEPTHSLESVGTDVNAEEDVKYEALWTEWLCIHAKLAEFKVDDEDDLCVMTVDTFSKTNVKLQQSKARLEGMSHRLHDLWSICG